jgi:hypothetical protein
LLVFVAGGVDENNLEIHKKDEVLDLTISWNIWLDLGMQPPKYITVRIKSILQEALL